MDSVADDKIGFYLKGTIIPLDSAADTRKWINTSQLRTGMPNIIQAAQLLPEINSGSEYIECSMRCAEMNVIFVTEGD